MSISVLAFLDGLRGMSGAVLFLSGGGEVEVCAFLSSWKIGSVQPGFVESL